MVKLANRARMMTATTGTGTVTLGAAVDGYQTFAAAGVSDSDVVRYVIEEGDDWEIGSGMYTSSGTTLTRTVSESSNSGSPINLSGSAEVFIDAVASDLDGGLKSHQLFTSSGTWTRPEGITLIKVLAHGAGGGGGGGTTGHTYGSGGGGGGGISIAYIDVSSISSLTITIGAGGSGGSSGLGGSYGGTTSVKNGGTTLAVGYGGSGGDASGSTPGQGGSGGGSDSGDVNIAFSAHCGANGDNAQGGNGGGGFFGGARRGGKAGSSALASNFGAGGCGVIDTRAGGNGGDGFVLIEEYA